MIIFGIYKIANREYEVSNEKEETVSNSQTESETHVSVEVIKTSDGGFIVKKKRVNLRDIKYDVLDNIDQKIVKEAQKIIDNNGLFNITDSFNFPKARAVIATSVKPIHSVGDANKDQPFKLTFGKNLEPVLEVLGNPKMRNMIAKGGREKILEITSSKSLEEILEKVSKLQVDFSSEQLRLFFNCLAAMYKGLFKLPKQMDVADYPYNVSAVLENLLPTASFFNFNNKELLSLVKGIAGASLDSPIRGNLYTFNDIKQLSECFNHVIYIFKENHKKELVRKWKDFKAELHLILFAGLVKDAASNAALFEAYKKFHRTDEPAWCPERPPPKPENDPRIEPLGELLPILPSETSARHKLLTLIMNDIGSKQQFCTRKLIELMPSLTPKVVADHILRLTHFHGFDIEVPKNLDFRASKEYEAFKQAKRNLRLGQIVGGEEPKIQKPSFIPNIWFIFPNKLSPNAHAVVESYKELLMVIKSTDPAIALKMEQHLKDVETNVPKA